MVDKIPFMKMNGCGNDFIVIDNRKNILAGLDISKFARKVCVRRLSIGADGLMTLENSKHVDFKMRYFNADGSEGEMCGNGARCISKFAYYMGVAKSPMKFETISGVHEAWITEESVRLKFPPVYPKEIILNRYYVFDDEKLKFHSCSVGVPHVIIYTDVLRMNYKEIYNLGKKIRYSNIFPQGTNVNFVQNMDSNNIIIRTYERGVEDETLACGTGSTAAAIVSGLLNKVIPPVNVHNRAGVLKIDYQVAEDCIKEIYMEGKAQSVVEGYILPEAYVT
mgnify:CR=1 FL=1